ncbi:hypothetical protein [Paraburkholderia sp. GAS334]|uniref:hypothetical protein n=1 Tax=Paraburkholderia sp. GAS334 TaxID=3035131 RepID=UPI003D2091C4
MTTGPTSQTVPSSPPWEDSLIIALRDLQWLKKNRALKEIFDAERRASLGSEVVRQRVSDVSKAPPLLAKFDGNAESASGDVLTSSEKRFFLLEFKASEAALSSENGKFVFNCLASLALENPDDKVFLELSRRGHHVLYPVVNPSGDSVPAGFLPVHQVTLTTRRYYDAVIQDVSVSESITASNLLWNRQELGLQVHEMAAYLDALATAHKGGSARHPLKVVVAGAGDGDDVDNFFWPCADLVQFIEFAGYFDNSLRNSASDTLYQRLRSQLSSIVARFAASANAAIDSDEVESQNTDSLTP